MFHSAEIRWFVEGEVPEAVRTWFVCDGMAIDEPPRVDEYLVLPGCATTGVKFRQYPGDAGASFEIKARTSDSIAVSVGESVHGYRDQWVKWSCRPAQAETFREEIRSGNALWVLVEKRRSLRKFAVGSNGALEVPPADRLPGNACQFELTSISPSIRDGEHRDGDSAEQWWSLSFEAFGADGPLEDCVEAAAREVFSAEAPFVLGLEQSLPYPGWLSLFADRA